MTTDIFRFFPFNLVDGVVGIMGNITESKDNTLPAKLLDRVFAGENEFKVLRQYKQMTQAELSEKSGVSIENIRKLEKGEQGTKKDRRAIGKALDLGADFFI